MILITALCLHKPSRVSSSPSFTSFICIVLSKEVGLFVVIGSAVSTVHSIVSTPGFDPGKTFGYLTEVRGHC